MPIKKFHVRNGLSVENNSSSNNALNVETDGTLIVSNGTVNTFTVNVSGVISPSVGVVVGNSNLIGSGLTVGNSTSNSSLNQTGLITGVCVVNNTTIVVGNNVINATVHTIGSVTLNTSTMAIGNITANSTVFTVGANLYLDTVKLNVGNATVNTTITQSNIFTSGNVNGSGLNASGNVTGVNLNATTSVNIGNATVNTVANSSQVSTATVIAGNITASANVNSARFIATTSVAVGANTVLSANDIRSGNSTANVVISTNGIVINPGAAASAISLQITAPTHAVSRRATLLIDDWYIGQDSGAGGTKDFFIYQQSAVETRFYIANTGKISVGSVTPIGKLHSYTTGVNPGTGISSFAITATGDAFGGGIGIRDGADIGIWGSTGGTQLKIGFGSGGGALTDKITFYNDGGIAANGVLILRQGTGDGAALYVNNHETIWASSTQTNWGYGTDGTKKNVFIGNVCIGDVTATYKLNVAGSIRASDTIIGTSGTNIKFRLVDGNYGSLLYQDGSNYYHLLTNPGTPYDTYNALRPLRIVLSSGDLYLASDRVAIFHANGHIAANSMSLNGVTVNPGNNVFSAFYESANSTITTSGLLSLTHGLGGIPKGVYCQLINVTGENGYVTGDIVEALLNSTSVSVNRYNTLKANSTVITVRYSNATECFAVGISTTGLAFGLTNANWRLIVKAWR